MKTTRRVVGTKTLRGFDKSLGGRGRGEAAERWIKKGLGENFWSAQLAPKKTKHIFPRYESRNKEATLLRF